MTDRQRLLVHTARLPMRWGDMDALGHVNNTVYFRYMEQARMEWVTGMAAESGSALPWTVVIVNASCTFMRPLVFPGDVEVRMLLAHPGRTSVASHYEVVRDGVICAEGAAKIVFVDVVRGRPLPIPASVASMLRDLDAAPHASAAATQTVREESR